MAAVANLHHTPIAQSLHLDRVGAFCYLSYMSTILEIRESYRATLKAATEALQEAESRERMRLAASLASEAKRAHEANLKVSKLKAKIEDYTARLKATGVPE